MRQRLMQAGRWPPQKPPYEKRRGRQFYFKHSAHPKAPEVLAGCLNVRADMLDVYIMPLHCP